MSKNKYKNDYSYKGTVSSGEHGPKQHAVVPVWGGTVQATNQYDLKARFMDYDLCLFLNDMQLPEEVPFCLGIDPPKIKSKIIHFILKDRSAPDDGPYWQWLVATLKRELKAGSKVGIACYGGHGRTGTIVATLWGMANAEKNKGVPEKNPITAIREIIGCDREVESIAQEEFVYEQTGFPPPKDGLASDSKWKGSGNQEHFTWWLPNGEGVSPIKLEPQHLSTRSIIYKKDSVVGVDVAVCQKEGWLVPVKLDNRGAPSNLPMYFCRACSAAMGYEIPAHANSHLKCTVCDLLKELGATQTKPDPKPPEVVAPVSTAVALPVKSDDLCDLCGKEFDFKTALFEFIDNETYQFCDEVCKGEFVEKLGGSKKESSIIPKGINFFKGAPCDAYINGSFCEKTDTPFAKLINGRALHFCSWMHLKSEEARRAGSMGTLAEAISKTNDIREIEPVSGGRKQEAGGSPSPKEEGKRDRSVERELLRGTRLDPKKIAPNGTITETVPAQIPAKVSPPKDERTEKNAGKVLDKIIDVFSGKPGEC